MARLQRRRITSREWIALMIGIVLAAMTSDYSYQLYAFPLYPYLGGPLSRAIAAGVWFAPFIVGALWIEKKTRRKEASGEE